MDGNIIDIKRFTLHDGYGIRSTVFLKGCGLRCAWCHNPEGLENRIDLWYLPKQCIRCQACHGVCPEQALVFDEDNDPYVKILRSRCTRCGLCVTACPTTALSFDGQRLSSEAVVEILLRDRQFYGQSGGGITLSGGDPLVQHQFSREILAKCRTEGLHTAIETCLQARWELVEELLEVTNLVIADLKIVDSQLHREYTGHGNELIKENYRRLVDRKVDLVTRIPLIPHISATAENIRALAGFIRSCNPGGRVELINFNPLAPNKYLLMNRSQEFFSQMQALTTTELDQLYPLLEAEGLTVIRDHRN
jgi:pyruvate formate lyase activating enzyme